MVNSRLKYGLYITAPPAPIDILYQSVIILSGVFLARSICDH